MALLSPEHYDRLALTELDAAEATCDPDRKKRHLNEASALATLAELARDAGQRGLPPSRLPAEAMSAMPVTTT